MNQSISLTGKPAGFKNWPHCEKCDKPVDTIEVEREIIELWGGEFGLPYKPYPELMYGSKVFITIQCHGEKWKVQGSIA